MQPTAPPLAAPTDPGERLEIVDILRGVALLGILLVNVLAFSGPYGGQVPALSYWQQPFDRAVEWAVLVFAEGSFYTIFSFLFGFGLALQLERAAARGEDAAPRFRRRLLVLLGFGLVHLFFIWFGDILTQYALVGLVLLAFRDWPPRRLLRAALALLLLANLIYLALGPATAAEIAAGDAEELVALYAHGSYAEILGERLQNGVASILSTVVLLPGLLWLFLLGLLAGKLGLFRDRERTRWIAVRVLRVALPLGLACKAAYGALLLLEPANPWNLVLATGLGGPAMGLSYLALLTLALLRPARVARWRPLAAAGRMALTNYLLQSVAATLVFYGYGFGLYGRLGPATTVPLAVGFFAVQVGISHLWLARFRFGPLEWLWRTLTYGRVQPLRRPRPTPADA